MLGSEPQRTVTSIKRFIGRRFDRVLEAVRKAPRSVVVDSEKLAKEAGTVKAQNIVLLGAASSFLILKEASLLRTIDDLFRGRGPTVLEANLKAFALGKKAAHGS